MLSSEQPRPMITVIASPQCATCTDMSGSSRCWHALHQTMIRTPTLAAWPKVNGSASPSLGFRLILIKAPPIPPTGRAVAGWPGCHPHNNPACADQTALGDAVRSGYGLNLKVCLPQEI